MNDTLLSGDIIVLNKFTYRKNSQRSILKIPIENLSVYLRKKYRTVIESVFGDVKKVDSLSTIKYGDVVVLISPTNSRQSFVKRCIALPGDTLLIIDSKVIINKQKISDFGSTRFRYNVFFNNYTQACNLFDSLNLNVYNIMNSQKGYFNTTMNIDQEIFLSTQLCIDSLTIEKERNKSINNVYPSHLNYKWSLDNFGPLIIPAKGMKIQLNKDNFILYNKIINSYELVRITEQNGKYYLNGILSQSYTFRKDYYFVLGDNRHQSNDSRIWGVIPKNRIIGKASMILMSISKKGIIWERFFKKIV